MFGEVLGDRAARDVTAALDDVHFLEHTEHAADGFDRGHVCAGGASGVGGVQAGQEPIPARSGECAEYERRPQQHIPTAHVGPPELGNCAQGTSHGGFVHESLSGWLGVGDRLLGGCRPAVDRRWRCFRMGVRCGYRGLPLARGQTEHAAGDAEAVGDAFDQVQGPDPVPPVRNLADAALVKALDRGGDAVLAGGVVLLHQPEGGAEVAGGESGAHVVAGKEAFGHRVQAEGNSRHT